MTTDFRALCVELTDCLEKADWPHRYKIVFQQWVYIARAALAEPDGPAVPDDRKPASVTGELSDADVLRVAAHALGYLSTPPWDFEPVPMSADDVLTIARAVLACCGQHTAPPAEEIGANSYQSLCRQLIKDLAAARDALEAWTEYFTENNQPTAKHFCMKEYESARDAHSKACNAMAILRRQIRLGCSAAALRAAADLVVPVSDRPEPSNEFEYGQWLAKRTTRGYLLAIAAELENN